MFVHYALDDLRSGAVSLDHPYQEDIPFLLSYCEKEGLDNSKWSIFETVSFSTHQVYGLESGIDIFYLEVKGDKTMIPHYFRNHGERGYSLFEAASIQEAMDRYERFYDPKS